MKLCEWNYLKNRGEKNMTEEDMKKIINQYKEDDEYKYMLLDRLRGDCDYYLGFGRRNEKNLWSGNVKDHILDMKFLYESFPDDKKPTWITMEEIKRYEKEMVNDFHIEASDIIEEVHHIYQQTLDWMLYQFHLSEEQIPSTLKQRPSIDENIVDQLTALHCENDYQRFMSDIEKYYQEQIMNRVKHIIDQRDKLIGKRAIYGYRDKEFAIACIIIDVRYFNDEQVLICRSEDTGDRLEAPVELFEMR